MSESDLALRVMEVENILIFLHFLTALSPKDLSLHGPPLASALLHPSDFQLNAVVVSSHCLHVVTGN